MARNKYGVKKRVWKKWPPAAQQLFNRMYLLVGVQQMFVHPEAPIMPRRIWKTLRWNVAWEAADELRLMLKK